MDILIFSSIGLTSQWIFIFLLVKISKVSEMSEMSSDSGDSGMCDI